MLSSAMPVRLPTASRVRRLLATVLLLIAMMPSSNGQHYYLEIILPGSVLGLIVGYATQQYGRSSTKVA